jgi:hypothetical protein
MQFFIYYCNTYRRRSGNAAERANMTGLKPWMLSGRTAAVAFMVDVVGYLRKLRPVRLVLDYPLQEHQDVFAVFSRIVTVRQRA